MERSNAASNNIFPSGDWFTIAMEELEAEVVTVDQTGTEVTGIAALLVIALIAVSAVFTLEYIYIRYQNTKRNEKLAELKEARQNTEKAVINFLGEAPVQEISNQDGVAMTSRAELVRNPEEGQEMHFIPKVDLKKKRSSHSFSFGSRIEKAADKFLKRNDSDVKEELGVSLN